MVDGVTDMEWKIVKHSDLSQRDLLRICELKNQHWPYGMESQTQWMQNNLQDADYHLLGLKEDEDRLTAYLTVTELTVERDGKSERMLGLGCVCVDKRIEHGGYGKQLVKAANAFIRSQQCEGILLCKDSLVGFYQKCGWNDCTYQTAEVAGGSYHNHIMMLDQTDSSVRVSINRNF